MRRRWKGRTWLRVAAAATLAATLGCAGSPTEPSSGDESRSTDPDTSLVQTLRVSDTDVRTGDTVRIASLVVNEGSVRVEVKARTCGLDFDTDLEHSQVGVRCMGYSTTEELAPGDSLEATAVRRVESGSGTYQVRVRHLLEPERWASFEMEVTGS